MPLELIPELTAALAGRYRIERVLGSGGMATVYLADDLRHRRKVAIKVLKPELSAALGRERFFREIEVTAGLQHPHILPLFDSGEASAGAQGPSFLYYVMPFVEGGSLRERLRRERQLPVDEAIAITTTVAEALTYAGAQGVVHRDVKPENILLRPADAGDSGEVGSTHALVADFGMARALAETGDDRLTGSGVALGTPAYMSPEQASGDTNVDARTDVYALACVLFEMLTGEPPFTGPTVRSVISKHLREPAPDVREVRDRVPNHVADAIAGALAKVSADRFGTARQFAEALASPGTASGPRARLGARGAPALASGARRRARTGALLAGVAALALVALVATDFGGMRTSLTRKLGAARTSVSDGERSVAVLPFANVGGSADDDYFSDGLTEELIATLSQLRSLRVAARTSAFAFKGQARDAREIAQALNVGTVLVGSVRKSADRIRVTAQLIDARTGLDLWSETYDERQLADVFDIQSDMARRIAAALEARLTPSEEQRIGTKPTENLAAYTLYLKGRYYWRTRGAQLDTAIEYFKRAIAIDSGYARAYAGLASAYGPQGVHGYLHPRDARERMVTAARRAIALDPQSSEGHAALGAYLHVFEWDWEGAERELRRAIQLDRNFSTAHEWYGHFLENMGRFEEALVERRLASALDPLVASSGVGTSLALLGRSDSALVAYRETLELDPKYWQAHDRLGDLLISRGDLAGAIASFSRAVATSGGTSRAKAGLARALALAGRTQEAWEVVRQIREQTAANGIQHPSVANALLALGDTTAAFEWLEGSFRQRHPAMTSIGVFEGYAGFRADPRFQDLLRRIGLPMAKGAPARP